MIEPARLLQRYEEGALTRDELLIRLCQAAAERPPELIAAGLPAGVRAEVRERSAAPPDRPDGCRVFHSVCSVGEYDWEGHFREETRRLYDGLWRWNRFFAGAEPGAFAGCGPDSGS